MEQRNNAFSFRRSGTAGCEILYNGNVIAWTVDEVWAALLTQRLNCHPCVAVGAGVGCPKQLVAAEEADSRKNYSHSNREK